MKKWITLIVVLLGLAGIGALDVAPAHAAEAGSGIVGNTLAGGYAAIGCGLFGRALGSGLVSAGTIAGAVATCLYMIIDALFFER